MSGLITGGPAPPEDAADDVAATRAAPKPASEEVASQGAASPSQATGRTPTRSPID